MPANYYILQDDCPSFGPIAYPSQDTGPAFRRGRKLQASPTDLTFELRVDAQAANPLDFPPLDYHKAYGGIPLFSPRAVTALTEAGVSNLEYVPCRVTYQPTGTILQYSATNVVGVAAGLDLSKSKCEVNEDGLVISIDSMKFDESKFRGASVVRLNERLPLIIVSKAVKEAVESAGLTGMLFITDEEWKPGML